MSFFKKLEKLGAEFESFLGDDKKKGKDGKDGKEAKPGKEEKKPEEGEHRGVETQYHSAPPQQDYHQPPQQYQQPPQQYQQPPQQYQQPPQQYQQPQQPAFVPYGQAPVYDQAPSQHYAPPLFPPPQPGTGQLPQGWVAQFDDNYKTWYYTSQTSGVSQWAHPYAVPTTAFPGQGTGERGYGDHGAAPGYNSYDQGQSSQYGGAYGHGSGGQPEYLKLGDEVKKDKGDKGKDGNDKDKKDKKKSGVGAGTVVAAGVGGVVVGALVANELGDSDSDSDRAPPPEEDSSSSEEEEEQDGGDDE